VDGILSVALWSWRRAGNRLIISLSPILRVYGSWLPCGVAWDAVPEQMEEYINPDFYSDQCSLFQNQRMQ
jgi:hypothetical protein